MKNSKGKVYYGMHFCAGVAEYRHKDGMFRVYLNEKTIRNMDPTFEGRPLYLLHVDDVPEKLNDVKKEADGWVIESFFNQADGKHWAKFVAVSEEAITAIESKKWRLSNCYLPQLTNDTEGQWNGVDYHKEIVKAEYLHLAIVPNPRYEESVILTPEEFKKYNESNLNHIESIANSKEQGSMLKLFKKQKVENSKDFDGVMVELPKSKKEMSLDEIVKDYDEKLSNAVHDFSQKGKVGDDEWTFNELAEKYLCAKNELDEMKAKYENEDKEDKEDKENEDDEDDDDKEKGDVTNDKDDVDEEEAKEKETRIANAKKEEAEKRKAAKAKADKLRNAAADREKEEALENEKPILTSVDKLSLGKKRYG